MTVVQLLNRFPVRSQQFIYNEIDELRARGLTVRVLTRKLTGSPVDGVRPLYVPARSAWRRVAGLAVDLTVLALRAPGPLVRMLRSLAAAPADSRADVVHAGRIFRSVAGGADLLHCQFATLAGEALWYRERGFFDCPVIVSLRGYDLTRRSAAGGVDWADLSTGVQRFLPVCRAFARDLADRGIPEERVSVHVTPLRVSSFACDRDRAASGGPVTLLSVGRLVEKKGFEYTIDAMRILRERGIEVTLTIVGDGPRLEALSSQISSAGLEASISVVPSLPHGELIERYHAHDLFVLHCVTAADGDREGIPNVLKEAMAASVPVVSTYHSGIPELVEHGVNGLLVAERDTTAFADAIASLVEDRDLRQRLARAGLERVREEYDIGPVSEQLISIYREIAG